MAQITVVTVIQDVIFGHNRKEVSKCSSVDRKLQMKTSSWSQLMSKTAVLHHDQYSCETILVSVTDTSTATTMYRRKQELIIAKQI